MCKNVYLNLYSAILIQDQKGSSPLQKDFIALSAKVFSKKIGFFYKYNFKKILSTHYSLLVENNLVLKLNDLDLFLKNQPFCYQKYGNAVCFLMYEQQLFKVFLALDAIVLFLLNNISPDIKEYDSRMEFLTIQDEYIKIQNEDRKLLALRQQISVDFESNK